MANRSQLPSLNGKSTAEALRRLESLGDKPLPGTTPATSADQARRQGAIPKGEVRKPASAEASKAINTRAATQRAKATQAKAGPRSSPKPSRKESPIQERMRLIREGKPVATAAEKARPRKEEETASSSKPKPKPEAPKEKSEGPRQEKASSPATKRIGSREEIKEWKNLARGLSGTRVKRFWKLINQGLAGKEAREEASRGYNPRPEPKPNTESNRGKPTTKLGKAAANPAPRPQKKTYASTVEVVRMAVFAKRTPQESLNQDQLTQVSEAILAEVMREETQKVKFAAIHFKPGTLIVECRNEDTAKWLKAAVARLSVEGPELMATEAKDAPTYSVMQVMLPRAAEMATGDAIKMLDHQNEGLNTGAWKVVSESVAGTAKRLVIYVDDLTAQAIQKQKGELSFRFGTILANLKQPGNDTEVEDNLAGNEAPEETEMEVDPGKVAKNPPQDSKMEEDELLSDLEREAVMTEGEAVALSDEAME